ncbi:hypothetical protein NU688_15150 [Variovorax sp. ZS18.2.2]|uniref:hypothetical protein n=1 Tax=Variovorax sp. ZS18.2.2 TaxID=2971255 RepID=UPI0021515C8F|nr:hypothetical protein [Variovorax sp. ZS18.2.2]MCR6477497.1 hypothetical protein [Variovorax sp. ZS18.2.2]
MNFRAIFQPGALVFASILVSQAASARTDAPAIGETPSRPSFAQKAPKRTACGGSIEKATWALWDESGRAWVSGQLLQKRLRDQGDTYALYDLESTLHNLLSMAIRCGRSERLNEFASDWSVAYGQLGPVQLAGSAAGGSKVYRQSMAPSASPDSSNPRGWICRGGASCNSGNRLRDTEVMLVSVQGLALLSQLANSLIESPAKSEKNEKFVNETAQLLASHLLRATDKEGLALWGEAIQKKPSDIVDGSSKYFFKDQELWLIGLYAEMAGILVKRPDLRSSFFQDEKAAKHHQRAIKVLLAFFNSRISLREINSPGTGKTMAAELDRGFWRLYSDNHYAGYTGPGKPAVCAVKDRAVAADLKVPIKSVEPVPTLGWDLSHSRRLVPVLDALERNRDALIKIFELANKDLPDPNLTRFFSAQLVAHVWNGDAKRPYFSNYWDGSNGWYRVAYSNGMDRCLEGYPPFGLSSAFPTGGYASWGRYYPILTNIGLSLLDATADGAPKPEATSDIADRYGSLMPQASPNVRVANRLMFWPSLVGVQ